MMHAFPPRWLSASIRLIFLCAATFICASATMAQSQSNAADLGGFVRDQQGAVVPNATVTARNIETDFTRTATSNDDGFYQIVQLPPGTYEVTAQATNFSKAVLPDVKLTVGMRADLDIPLQVGEVGASVTVSGATTDIVETSRTAVANTIEEVRIDNLPINQRDYLGFATTISTVNRGNDRPIGPAPSSGLNIGGQRGRSTLVQVDGADNTDNSINASRSTVSQEAVQEFQVATNSYAAEFGRATGGIVNVVTKSGTNDFHGNIFGFLRDRHFQARNAFAPIEDPPFTRVQYGATFGGPIKKDRTFFFAAFEQRRRRESGFFTSDVAAGLNATVSVGPGTPFPFLPFRNDYTNLTGAQAAFVQGEFQRAIPLLFNPNPLIQLQGQQIIARTISYATIASAGGQTALNGLSILRSPGGAITAGSFIGPRFFLSGAPIPSLANNGILPGFITADASGQAIAFRPLLQLQRIFPIKENTTFFSVRADHQFNTNNQLTLRFGYNPSDLTGIQDESQNQVLGQNDFSRTGFQTLRDISFVSSLTSTLSNTVVNEARFSFSRRKATFDSQVPGAAIQISGAAFMGSNPFSPVDRTEKRFQITDNVNWIVGNHTFKFGADFNFVDVGARFELNFPGLFNFGAFSLGPFLPGLPTSAPPLTPVQSYGAGTPGVFIEGFGNPNSALKNKPLAFFAQDSWKIRPNLTINYGIRYDIELTQQFPTVPFTDPLTGITLSAADLQRAQDVVNVQQGFPRDKNNFAPRFGLAWDITNDGKTVLRAAYGIFYDHPLLAISFNSDIADAAQQQQFTTVLPGSPASNATLNLLQIFQGTVCSDTPNPLCGLPPGIPTPGVAPTAQYLPGQIRFNDQRFVGFGPILPFTLAVSKDFEYAYAQQANITVERQLTKNMSFSASILHVGARHLPHPQDVNAPRTDLLAENFRRFAGRAPTSFGEAIAFIPSAPTAQVPFFPCPGGVPLFCFNNPTPGPNQGQIFALIVPGIITAPLTNLGNRSISPLVANFFRPSAPNYFFAQSITGGLLTPARLDGLLPGTLRTPGPISPFGDVSAQVSDANSEYNALNLELKRRFSNNFQFLASYTWSHAIDESSDLQTLLKPQDNRNRRAERANSLFDQRHRFVFSAVYATPTEWRTADSFGRRFFADFTIAPILEISSGRPFNIITGTDTNADLQSSNDRPSVAGDGTLFISPFLSSGNLARNSGITHGYASLDLRITRGIRLSERVRLDIIAEGFNLFNRFNEAGANPFFDAVNDFGERAENGRFYSRPTAAYDPRQFQFGFKLNF